jgi:hypothetical protein
MGNEAILYLHYYDKSGFAMASTLLYLHNQIFGYNQK